MMLLLGKYLFILLNNPSPLCIRKEKHLGLELSIEVIDDLLQGLVLDSCKIRFVINSSIYVLPNYINHNVHHQD
jgi:hypothetical protein